MTQKEIIEEIKLRASAIFGYISENEELFLQDDTMSVEYIAAIDNLNRWSGELRQHINGLKGFRFASWVTKEVKAETKRPLSPEEVKDQSTPFYQKQVVITGNLSAYPQREELAALLRRYGADINTSISRLTDIVIMGEKAGPSKQKKIKELKDAGCPIQVIAEPLLLDILEQYGMR
mgnify:FL=1